MKFSAQNLKKVIAILLLGSQAATLLPMDLSINSDESGDSGVVYMHMPSPKSSPTNEESTKVELDTLAADGVAVTSGLPKVETFVFTDEENKLLEGADLSDDEKNYCKSCIKKLKACGLWTKDLFKSQIFNLLGVLNLIVALMVIYDGINTKINKDAHYITPQWALGSDAALSLAGLGATAYAQYCKNKLDAMKETGLNALEAGKNALSAVADATVQLVENEKSKCRRLWNWVKKNPGYIYSAVSATFATVVLIDTLVEDFEIPRDINFADNCQAIAGSIGSFLAQHYQNKLEKLKESQSETTKLLDEEHTVSDSDNLPA